MLVDQAAELEKCETIETLWHGAIAALATVGFEHAIYLTVRADCTDPFLRCTLPGLYDQSPPEQDPFLHWACDSYQILSIGAEFVTAHPYISKAERSFIERAGKAGIRAALGIPMRLQGSDRFGGFVVGNAMDRATFTAQILPQAEAVRLFCLLIHRRIEELTDTPAPQQVPAFRNRLLAPDMPAAFDALSPREREVIYLLAHGHTRQQCAQTCGISVHTVSDYAKSGYRKLGVNNRAQAAAIIHEAGAAMGNGGPASGP